MAQNFLYMFEFVVDDLMITRPNYCAPEEYPTCVELTFRSNCFVQICDREFGKCVDMKSPKCGKCCLFSMESPITDKDRLRIHVYKKKTDKCKFLLGATDLQVKSLFDKVTEDFNIENVNWEQALKKQVTTLPDPRAKFIVIDNECEKQPEGRREQLCPTSEVSKRLLPLFSCKPEQTGNMLLVMRLVCHGPAIVTRFPFGNICSQPCAPKCPKKKSCPSNDDMDADPCDCDYKKSTKCGCPAKKKTHLPPNCPSCPMSDPCNVPPTPPPPTQRYFACNSDRECPFDECEDGCDRNNATIKCPVSSCTQCYSPRTHCPKKKPTVKILCGNAERRRAGYESQSATPRSVRACSLARESTPTHMPCIQPSPPPLNCQRYFQRNDDDSMNGCGCQEVMDECMAEECSSEEEDGICSISCSESSEEEECMQPCFVEPRKPDPGPDAFEEFEACLNGSALVIRVRKDSHEVENVFDGADEALINSGDECDKCTNTPNNCKSNCDAVNAMYNSSNFAHNFVRRRSGGQVINHPRIPKIRANIKYSGNDTCAPAGGTVDSYHVPFTKIREMHDNQENKVDLYRRRGGFCHNTCEPFVPPKPRDDTRNFCLQVDPKDLKNTMKGINVDTRKKGIEVCYKNCVDTESDVFLVNLGSKHRCQHKRNNIEIELKTPKQPIVLPVQLVTTETQVNESQINGAMNCEGKKKKGKKGKKGKK